MTYQIILGIIVILGLIIGFCMFAIYLASEDHPSEIKSPKNIVSLFIGEILVWICIFINFSFWDKNIENIFIGIMFIIGGFCNAVGILTLGVGYVGLIALTFVQFGRLLTLCGKVINNIKK